MILGIGTDIIEVSRIRAGIERYPERFLNRLFTSQEQTYCLTHRDATPHFAGRFAAKEAIVKALGTGFSQGLSWLDFEIHPDNQGKPCVQYSEKVKHLFGSPKIMISISHCREYATAFAVWHS